MYVNSPAQSLCKMILNIYLMLPSVSCKLQCRKGCLLLFLTVLQKVFPIYEYMAFTFSQCQRGGLKMLQPKQTKWNRQNRRNGEKKPLDWVVVQSHLRLLWRPDFNGWRKLQSQRTPYVCISVQRSYYSSSSYLPHLSQRPEEPAEEAWRIYR